MQDSCCQRKHLIILNRDVPFVSCPQRYKQAEKILDVTMRQSLFSQPFTSKFIHTPVPFFSVPVILMQTIKRKVGQTFLSVP
jgi:hypothetical protein